jgi:hypothetical protein
MSGVIAKIPGMESYMPEDSDGSLAISPAFGREAFFSPLANGFLLASSDTFSIRRYDPTGGLSAIFRTVQDPVRVSGAINERARQALAEKQPTGAPPWFSTELPLSTEANPDFLPAFEGLIAELDGTFMVGSAGGGRYQPNVWRAFSSEGALAYSVEFPSEFRPLKLTGGFVVGRTRDDWDVEYVVVRKIGPCRKS